ncbi:MAG TPA: hypothetical protein VH914_14615 [Acidimicrobiia bacterium]|nr:hypothetical protein [Acidimicrobiia bacterium]
MKRLCIGASVALLTAMTLGSGAAAATPAWRLQTVKAPAGATDADLRGVSCPAATACTTVGVYLVNFTSGGPTAAGWDGTRWKAQRVAATVPTQLGGVSCVASTQCVAVGSSYDMSTFSSAPAAAVWNGTKWTGKKVPVPATATGGGTLNGVSCASATACVAVGSVSVAGSVPLAASWNGTRWKLSKPHAPKASPSSEFWGVSCATSTSCVAVGESYDASGTNSVPMAQVWNGSSWTVQTVPTPAHAFAVQLNSVSCSAAASCTAVGYYHLNSGSGTITPLIERWNGTSWTVQTSGVAVGVLWGVSCAASSTCMAVGGLVGAAAIAQQWDGTTWVAKTVPTPAGASNPGLRSVSCTAANACTAVGSANASSGHLQDLVERFS